MHSCLHVRRGGLASSALQVGVRAGKPCRGTPHQPHPHTRDKDRPLGQAFGTQHNDRAEDAGEAQGERERERLRAAVRQGIGWGGGKGTGAGRSSLRACMRRVDYHCPAAYLAYPPMDLKTWPAHYCSALLIIYQ